MRNEPSQFGDEKTLFIDKKSKLKNDGLPFSGNLNVFPEPILLKKCKFASNKKNMKFSCFLILLYFLFSCTHEQEILQKFTSPQILAIRTDSTLFSDTTLGIGTPIQFRLWAKADSGILLQKARVERILADTVYVLMDSVVNQNSLHLEVSSFAQGSSTSEKWVFTVQDEKFQSSVINIHVTTVKYPVYLNFIQLQGFVHSSEQMDPGSLFKIGIVASSPEANLENIRITKKFDQQLYVLLDSAIHAPLAMFELNDTAGWQERDWMYVFSATNQSGDKDSLTLMIYVVDSDLMTEEYNGILWNSIGPNPHAWDLILNLPRGQNEPDSVKDMINSTYNPAQEPVFFENGWHTYTRTRFTKQNAYDYNQARKSTAVDAFSGSTISSGLSYAYNINSNDIFIARLRGENKFTVIKITNVIYTNNDSLDRIEFRYKK